MAEPLRLKGSAALKTRPLNHATGVSVFCRRLSKEYAEILGSSVRGYSYLSSPTGPTVSLVSKAF